VGTVLAVVGVGARAKAANVGCTSFKLLKRVNVCKLDSEAKREDRRQSFTTYRVRSVDTRVDNVGANTLPGATVVDVLAGAGSAVGDTAKTPRGTVLSDICIRASNSILLNVLDLEPVVSGEAQFV
jgi:hypothetical protein